MSYFKSCKVLRGVSALLFSAGITILSAEPGDTIYQRGFLSIEEAHKSIELPDGYSLELVLSDPNIEDP